jgi:diguanylate cyclase (GGDEF)-like protein
MPRDWDLLLLDGLVGIARIFDAPLAGCVLVEGTKVRALAVDNNGQSLRILSPHFQAPSFGGGEPVKTRSIDGDPCKSLLPGAPAKNLFSVDCQVDVDASFSLLLGLESGGDEPGLEIIEQLSAIASLIALAHGRQLEKGRAFSDALTGLFGRRYLDVAFPAEVERARRHQVALTVVMVDLDHFKSLNDQKGHAFGDEVLRAFGACLREELRRSDIAIRYGGDEFVLLLPGTNLEGAQLVIGRIRERLKTMAKALHIDAKAFTISVGVACAAPLKDPDLLFEEADRNLYRAKRMGRNRSVTPASGTRQFATLPSLPEKPVLLRSSLGYWEEDHTPN